MADFIKNFQNKPEPVKKLVMWLGVFLAMAAIFIFWFSNFPWGVSAPVSGEVVGNFQLPDFWNSLGGQLSNLKNLWPR